MKRDLNSIFVLLALMLTFSLGAFGQETTEAFRVLLKTKMEQLFLTLQFRCRHAAEVQWRYKRFGRLYFHQSAPGLYSVEVTAAGFGSVAENRFRSNSAERFKLIST
jgi:hypothetical protein